MRGHEQTDYLMRMIEQAALALRAALGLRKSGDYEQALCEVQDGIGLLLDNKADFISRVDGVSAARFLGDPQYAETYACLLFEKGDL